MSKSALAGRRIYRAKCAACHGQKGRGVGDKFPPLAGVAWVQGSPMRLAALTLDGLTGKRKIAGTDYRGVMPAWRGVLTAPEIAAVLTYIRRAWGNRASPISTELVHKVSDRFQKRGRFWTGEELQALPGE
ncbi:MAG: c-type cytochrome [Rhodanobacteraceae bacterium]